MQQASRNRSIEDFTFGGIEFLMSHSSFVAAITIASSVFWSTDRAAACVVGFGDYVEHLASVPDKAKRDVRHPHIGFIYYQARFFWVIPFWSSHGQYVAFGGQPGWARTNVATDPSYEFLGTDVADVSRRTGIPASQLEPPLSYRHAWGWYLLGGIFAAFLAGGSVAGIIDSFQKRRHRQKKPA